MLGSLARKLRAFGFDTIYYREGPDVDLEDLARSQGRIILTSDRALLAHAKTRGIFALLVLGRGERARLKSMTAEARRLGLSLTRGPTRCALCNGELAVLRAADAARDVPPSVLKRHLRFYRCPSCGKLYWKGRQWVRLRRLSAALPTLASSLEGAGARDGPSLDRTSITVRRAKPSDAEEIVRLWRGVAREKIYVFTENVSRDQAARVARRIRDRRSLVVVAQAAGRTVGELTLTRFEPSKAAHLRNLGIAVAKGQRGMGVGTALMEYAINWARSNGLRKITLGVFSSNPDAMRLYRKFGFEVEGRLRDQFLVGGTFVDEVLMGLDLTRVRPGSRNKD